MHVPLRARRGERNEVAERKLEQAVSENSEGGGITSHTSFFGIFFDIADTAEFSACATEG